MLPEIKYTLIDKLAYELYVQDALKDKNIYQGYMLYLGFQSFVKDNKIYNNCNIWYNDKRIFQKIRKEKLKKINESSL